MQGYLERRTARISAWAGAALALGAACSPCIAASRPQARPYEDHLPLMQSLAPGITGGMDGGGTGLIAAADNVVQLQCPNGGWNWPYGGCGSTFNNITGPIGIGLLRAHAVTGIPSYLAAAIAGANHDMTFTFGYGGTKFASFEAAFFAKLSVATGNSTWVDEATDEFFDRLAADTYGDSSMNTCALTFPGNTYDYINRHKCLRSGGLVNLRAWDMQYMPWIAGIIGSTDSAPGDGISQQQTFLNDEILDALDNLDAVNPGVNPAYFGETIGLAGAVHALALNNTTSLPAINAPNYSAITGIDTLCELADHLASLQDGSGAWTWTANLNDPGDRDTQTTAYAVLALAAAEAAGCGPYTTAIDNARAWLWTMQDPADGGFYSYPGGDKNIETNAEVMSALGVSADVSLSSGACANTGTVVVTIGMGDVLSNPIVGGQFFLEYDNAVLDFVSAAPGNAPFTLEVFESVNEGAGTIDYAVGVPGGGPGTTSATTMVVLTFNALQEVCDTADLVTFRSHTPPTQLSDDQGNPIVPDLGNLGATTIDSTDPVIDCPPNIVVNADAGSCSAIVDLYSKVFEVFDDAVALSNTQAPGVWYTDRYPPFGFTNAVFGGGNRLKHSIDASDCETCRPSGYNSAFYNTQGRKYDIPGMTSMSIQLYVPAAWAATGRRMAGFWGTGFDISNAVSSFPIIEFSSDGGTPRFRGWDSVGGVWIDLGLPSGFAYDTWQTVKIDLVGADWVYTVGDLTLTVAASGSVQIGNVILQGHNNLAGVTYDIYWDNFSYSQIPTASDNCDSNPLVVGTRSDSLALSDPYPTGVTTITWTATDACGNWSECFQTVTVNASNTLIVDLQLAGSFSTTFTRCVRFELSSGGPGTTIVDQDVTFVNGVANDVEIDVPCGLYTCITARDRKHTLRRTDSALAISGVNYLAAFTGADALVGGNLNDDAWIDILDFGIFVGQFGSSPGANTLCGYVGNHADITGDGTVNVLDFNFISINFLQGHEANCSGVSGLVDGLEQQAGPIQRISNRELIRRGLQELTAGDLNHDGWLDMRDIAQFMNGQ